MGQTAMIATQILTLTLAAGADPGFVNRGGQWFFRWPRLFLV